MTENLEIKTKKEILLVDDTESVRTSMGYLLEMDGYKIRHAENGKEAYNEINKKIPDLIISDVDMPVMDGFGLLEKIKESEYKNLKIIMTSNGNYERKDFGKYSILAYYPKNDMVLNLTKIIDEIFKNFK